MIVFYKSQSPIDKILGSYGKASHEDGLKDTQSGLCYNSVRSWCPDNYEVASHHMKATISNRLLDCIR